MMIRSAPPFSTNLADSPIPARHYKDIPGFAGDYHRPAPAPRMTLPEPMVSRKCARAAVLFDGRGMAFGGGCFDHSCLFIKMLT